jgi:hypothetical protein
MCFLAPEEANTLTDYGYIRGYLDAYSRPIGNDPRLELSQTSKQLFAAAAGCGGPELYLLLVVLCFKHHQR